MSKLKEVAQKVENLAIPLEEKVDPLLTRVVKSKWTWLIVLSFTAVVAVIF